MLSIIVVLLISLSIGSSNRGEWGTCGFYLTPSACGGKPLSSHVKSKLQCLWSDDGRGCYPGTLEDVNAYCQQFKSAQQCSYHTEHCEFKYEKCGEKSHIDKAKEAVNRPMVTFDDTKSLCFALPPSTCQGAKDENNRVCAWNSSAKQCQPLRNIKCSIWTKEQLCRNAYGSDSACKWDNDACTETDREDVETFAVCSYQLNLDECTQHSHCIWLGDYCEGMNSVDGKPHKIVDRTKTTFSFIELCASLTDQGECLNTGCDWNLKQKKCSSGGDLFLQATHAHRLQKSSTFVDPLIGIDGEQKSTSIGIFWIILAGTLSGFLFALCVYHVCFGNRYRRKKELMCFDVNSHPHPEIYDDLMKDVHEPVKMDDLPDEKSIPNPSSSKHLAYV